MLKRRSATAKTMLACLCAILGGLAALGLCLIFLAWPFERPLAFVLGLLLGGLCSALRIVLMDRGIAKSVEMDRKPAQNYGNLQSLLRYGLTVATIILAVLLRQWVGLIGTFAGVLSLQLAGYATHLVEKRRSPDAPLPAPPEAETEPE